MAIEGMHGVSKADNCGTTFSDFFTNAIFPDIVISLSAQLIYTSSRLVLVCGFFRGRR